MKARFVFKKIILFFVVLLFVLTIVPFTTSCVPKLTFGNLLFCESIDDETGEAIDPKDEFDIDVEKLFAVIKASGVKAEDNYRFTLKNKDTGEIIQDITEKYSRKEKGFLVTNVRLELERAKEKQLMLEPGDYLVEFYHKGELIEDADFKIKKPDAKILEVVLSNEINENSEPVNPTDTFGANDIFYACVKLDYRLAGDNLAAKWYLGEDQLIDEVSLDIEEDLYSPEYTAFNLSNGGDPWPAGDYKVEIYFNEALYNTYDFKVEGDETAEGPAAATFDDGNVYVSEDYGFSIRYPDDWTYEENEEAGESIFVTFSPVYQNIPVIIITGMLKEGSFDPDMLVEQADELIKEITSGGDFDRTKISEDGQQIFGYDYEEYIYTFVDEDGIEYQIDYTMILKDEDLFIFIGVSTSDYADAALDIYINSFSTISFFKK